MVNINLAKCEGSNRKPGWSPLIKAMIGTQWQGPYLAKCLGCGRWLRCKRGKFNTHRIEDFRPY